MKIQEQKFQININETSFFFGIGLVKFVNCLQTLLGEKFLVKVESKVSLANPLFILNSLAKQRLLSNMVDIADVMTVGRIIREIRVLPNIHNIVDRISWRIVNVGSESARYKSLEYCIQNADKSQGFVKINMTFIEISTMLQSRFGGDMQKFVKYFEDLGLRNQCDIKIGIEIDWNKDTMKAFLEKIAMIRKFNNPKVTFGIDFDPVHHSQEMRKANPGIQISEIEEQLLDIYLIHKRKILSVHLHDVIFGTSPSFDATHLAHGNLSNFYERFRNYYDPEIPIVVELHPVIILKMLLQRKQHRIANFVSQYLTFSSSSLES